MDFDIHGQKTLWRAYDSASRNGLQGEWLFDPHLVSNVADKDEPLDKIGVLPNTWDTNYDRIGKLETAKVNSNTDAGLRVSTAGQITAESTGERAAGTARQFLLIGPEDVNSGPWSDVASMDEIFGG